MSDAIKALWEKYQTEGLTAVERHKRQAELLGPENAPPRGRLPVPGGVSVDPVAEARQIRELLKQAEAAEAEESRLRTQIEAVDPMDVDEWHLEMMRTLPGERVPVPGADARPTLDPAVLKTLQDSGFLDSIQDAHGDL